jgi:hypothetical protein
MADSNSCGWVFDKGAQCVFSPVNWREDQALPGWVVEVEALGQRYRSSVFKYVESVVIDA